MKEKPARHIYVRNERLLVPDVGPFALDTRFVSTIIYAAVARTFTTVNRTCYAAGSQHLCGESLANDCLGLNI